MVKSSLKLCLLTVVCVIALLLGSAQSGYTNDQEQQYLQDFPTLISKSYSVPLPSSIISQCKNAGTAPAPLPSVDITQNVDAAQFQSICGTGNLCVVNAGVTVTLNGNVNVAGILNRGIIQWTDASQTQAQQYLCSGYVVTTDNGLFNLSVTSDTKQAYIYLKDNGAYNTVVGSRVFGGYRGSATLTGYPRVEVTGRPLRRTWSLLGATARVNDTTIRVMHDANAMGWKVGDRIALATTTKGSSGTAQSFFIKSINFNTISLSADDGLSSTGSINQVYLGESQSVMKAEVMDMSRNVIITGDDFVQKPCGDAAGLCPCRFSGEVCTFGLHTIMHGNNTRNGGTYRLQNTRVEKCGQRGAIGRYCVHFHAVRDCADCIASGNAIEYSHHRGVVIHDTHMATAQYNTIFDVRGVGIYIEDGNELFNYVLYNSVVCPWPHDGVMNGCTVPGTDNGEADASINGAAYWSLSQTNHFIGNRAANSFNGIFYHPSFGPNGRQISDGHVCANYLPLGRFEGNTCHGHGRFGTYFVASTWPRQIITNLSVNGWTDPFSTQCAPFTSEGYDRGLSAAIWNNVDYHNVFVGGYALGDVQFRNHTAISSNCLIYHKETKNFNDGCSAHYLDYHFEDGGVLLPSGHGTILFENPVFKGNTKFESNHHCGEGVTGILCNPQYIFINPTWNVTSTGGWLTWNDGNNPSHGASYNLSPDDAKNPRSSMFPPGYQGVAHGIHTWLLALDGGKTCNKSSDFGMAKEYENGILCKKPFRRLEVYTQGYAKTDNPTGTVTLEVADLNGNVITSTPMYFMVIPADTRKQGFTIPIIATLDYKYTIRRNGGIPASWIIEFSDVIMGSRWTKDQIYLQVEGRTCPTITTSQHDRRFIFASADQGFTTLGRGACTAYPDMPIKTCQGQQPPDLMNCNGQCSNCNGANQYCDCGSLKCMCRPGFSGPNCETDICESARCKNGKCMARFLGGDLPIVTDGACLCDSPYSGATCEANPCATEAGSNCNGHGKCIAQSETTFTCACAQGYRGSRCEITCEGYCQGGDPPGKWPFGCNGGLGHASFCGKTGGCGYNDALFNQSGQCCFAFCDACDQMSCPTPDNDCLLPSATCQNGVCGQFQYRVDGANCQSAYYGKCKQGACISSPPPNVPSVKPTQAPSTQAPSTKPSTQAPSTSSSSTQAPPVTVGPTPTLSSSIYPKYIGCYPDTTGQRDLPISGTGNNAPVMTVDICVSSCRALKKAYAALQYGQECWCGNTYGNRGGKVSDNECNMPCKGNSTQKCGAGDRNSIYQVMDTALAVESDSVLSQAYVIVPALLSSFAIMLLSLFF